MTEPEPYRRGLTLGLTVAEILILLLFLLLLSLYAFNVEIKAKSEQIQTELETVKKELDEARSKLPEDIQELKRENKSLEKDLKDARRENTISKALLKRKEKEHNQYREENKEVQKSLREENAQLHAKLYSSKGIDPPCWYEVIDRKGERHEKPYYLLDIAVHDEHLRVRLQPAPPGRAIDENGQLAPTSYAEEYAKLPLFTLDTTGNVSIRDLEKFAKPIRRIGKNKQIRNYSCVFYVKVWDLTSETAKKRWQQAEDAIKNWFYTYRVHNDSWEAVYATN